MVNLQIPNFNIKDYELPKVRCVQQAIPLPLIENIESKIREELKKIGINENIKMGEKIAITASSRGIPNQALILKTIATYFKELKTEPFIIPAMGSHGGATAEGQLSLLRDYGITEKKVGCPLKSSMEVVKIGETNTGIPVYLDKYAALADKIFIFNRIRSHSKFIGEVESGLSKMCLMGLGKHEGTKLYHQFIEQQSWPEVVDAIRNVVFNKAKIIGGLAIIQNINNQIAELHALRPEEFSTKEPILLQRYKELTEKMPFQYIDLLIVDEMGKNIFGTGMDTNITGRKSVSKIRIKWLFVRDLTEETHGNAQGIGLADFTTKRVIEKIDLSKTYLNALTAYRTDSPKLPIILSTDKDVFNIISFLLGPDEMSSLQMVWIQNTSKLLKMLVSEALFEQVQSNELLRFCGEAESIKFDSEGFLITSKKYW